MSLAVINTRANIGLKAPPVSVEVHLSNGLPAFNIVGLPEAAVKDRSLPQRRLTLTTADI